MIVVALVAVALYVSLGRYYINYVERYQDVLMERVIAETQLPLSVGRLSGQWSRLSPVLSLQGVELVAADGGKSVLTATELSIKLDVINSLLSKSLRFKKFTVTGLQCALQEASPGHWNLKGYPVEQRGQDFGAAVDLLLSLEGVELSGAELELDFSRGEDATLNIQELSLYRSDSFRRLRLNALIDNSDRPLLAVVETRGDPRELDDFSARAYIKVDDLDFSQQLPAMQALGIELHQAVIDSELWVDWHPGTEVVAQGFISTPYLDIEALSGEQLRPLLDMSLSFHLEKSSRHDWKLWLPTFETHWQGELLSFENIALAWSGRGASVTMSTLSLDQTVKQLLAVDLLNESQQELLKTLSPGGNLKNIHLLLRREEPENASGGASLPRFSLRANLDDVSIQPWHGAPGSTGVSGYLELEPAMGLVELNATDMTLEFPHVYHHALSFESLRGQIKWSIDQERLALKSGPLTMVGEHGPGSGLLSLDLPLKRGEGTPLMDLAIGIHNTDAGYRNMLIPYTLDQHFLDWMSASVPSGEVVEGGFIYRGSLLKADSINRTVQLFFNVDNTVLDYHKDWPPLHDISGLVLIDDGDVRVETESARIYSMNVDSALVTVDQSPDGPWLSVDARASGSAAGALQIINNSLINELVDNAFQEWTLEGRAAASVILGVPLSKSEEKTQVTVDVQLTDSELSIPAYKFELDRINGPIHFSTEKGLFSAGLSAQLYDKPMSATIGQFNDAVTIDMAGKIAMNDVLEWSQQPALAFVEGETDFDAEVYIAPKSGSKRAGSRQSELLVTSDLRGISIDLPRPFMKAEDQLQKFSLRQSLSTAANLLTLNFQDRSEMQFKFDQGRLASGLIVLGAADKTQHYPGKLVVRGGVEEFDLDQWREVLDRYLKVSEGLPGGEQPGLQLAGSDLKIGLFKGFSQQFESNVVDFLQRDDGWWLSAINPTFDSEIFIPRDSPRISVLFDRLELSSTGSETADEELLDTIDLKNFSDFYAYVAIADLWKDSQQYGSLNFELVSSPGSVILKNLGGFVRGVRIGVKKPALLEWHQKGDKQTTHLSGDFDFQDFGEVLAKWHYERIIESEKGQGYVDLTWPGSPEQFLLAASAGNLGIELDKGRFLQASNTTSGTLKVVGIVNLMNVVRRLRLDFSDLLDKGISYDRVRGTAEIVDGQMRIRDALEVKSPSSRFTLVGTADLENSRLDMELVATLPVASNLPWIAALAGGLPTAAGVYLASKIFEDQVDRFSSAVYTVKGDWNNPELKFKRVFDNTNKKNDKNPSDNSAKKH